MDAPRSQKSEVRSQKSEFRIQSPEPELRTPNSPNGCQGETVSQHGSFGLVSSSETAAQESLGLNRSFAAENRCCETRSGPKPSRSSASRLEYSSPLLGGLTFRLPSTRPQT